MSHHIKTPLVDVVDVGVVGRPVSLVGFQTNWTLLTKSKLVGMAGQATINPFIRTHFLVRVLIVVVGLIMRLHIQRIN